MRVYVSVFLLSASTLAFELVLSRLFAVTQFYHFAFMAVSLALLGIGASGTALSVFPALRGGEASSRVSMFSLAASLAMLGSFTVANRLPFDSFAIAWDRRQILYLAAIYLALAVPFFFSALAVGWLLSVRPADAPHTYAANLTGSATGCLLILGALAIRGGEGAALFCAWLAGLGAVAAALPQVTGTGQERERVSNANRVLLASGLAAVALLSAWLFAPPEFVSIQLSPYKSLSQTLRVPGAELLWTRWDAASRVDLVRSTGIRSFPGMSYAYLGPLPGQDGLTFDGDDLSPIALASGDTDGFAHYMPSATAYELRPGAATLILGARGGLDALVAAAGGAGMVTAVEPNAIAVRAVEDAHSTSAVPVRYVIEDTRSFIRRSRETFDIIQPALTQPYRPVTSGAYSLAENYDLTVEGFRDALARLNEDGLLVATRWLQTPPSEGLRLFAIAVTAAERSGLDPRQSVIALRGYNTVTIIVKRGDWTQAELDIVRDFAGTRKFDIVAAPGLRAENANLHNVLADDAFYRTFNQLLESSNRASFYGMYPFDVKPPTDDWPFFGHYFKWSQAADIWAQLGKTWQPFGGAGYYVLVVMLVFVTAAAGLFILLPLVVRGGLARAGRHAPRTLVYFAMIGLGFLFVEIPLIQRLILYVGRPTYALATVLFGLLLFCGVGSWLSARAPWRAGLALLAVMSAIYPFILPVLFQATLGLPLVGRFTLGVVSLAPLGLLMGLPLPKGIAWLERAAPGLIPWAWAINGAVSVIASVLAALVALSTGFTPVLAAGAVCYGIALAAIWRASP